MKQFEHEVLSFNTSNKKGMASMKTALSEWGAAGYEVVSVVPHWPTAGAIDVFLKREASGISTKDEEVA